LFKRVNGKTLLYEPPLDEAEHLAADAFRREGLMHGRGKRSGRAKRVEDAAEKHMITCFVRGVSREDGVDKLSIAERL